MANSILGFEPDPNTPGAGTAKLSDGSTLYGRQSDFQPYVGNQNQSLGAPTQPPAQAPTQEGPAPQGNARDSFMLNAGLGALGATPRDVAAQYALQQTGRNVDLPTLLAAKKTQVIPGTPAMTQKTEANQFPWRTGKQTIVEGARPIDEDRWGRVQDLAHQAVDAQSRAALAEGQASEDVARAQAESAQRLHNQMAAQQAVEEQRYQAQHTQMISELDDASKSTPDQQRWFKDHGAVGTIFAILGSAAQGYAMGLRGQFGPSMLERFINNDIQQQNLDIERRGAGARNKLADLSQQWGSIEAGRAALKASQLRLGDAQLQQLAATARDPAMRAKVEAMQADLQKQIAEADFNLRQAAQGTQRTSEAAQYMLPRKACCRLFRSAQI